MIFWTLPILFSENIFLAQRPLLNSCDWVVITLNSSFRCTESTGRQRELNRVLIGSVLLLLGRDLLVTWRALLVLRIFSLLILRSLSMFLRPWLSVAWEIADIVLFWYTFCIRSSMLHVSCYSGAPTGAFSPLDVIPRSTRTVISKAFSTMQLTSSSS
jgi:hypothetical protein